MKAPSSRKSAPPASKSRALTLVTTDTVEPTAAAEPARVAEADAERRRAMIAEAAYYRAEQRSFAPGGEIEDWCAAENEIDALLAQPAEPTSCGT